MTPQKCLRPYSTNSILGILFFIMFQFRVYYFLRLFYFYFIFLCKLVGFADSYLKNLKFTKFEYIGVFSRDINLTNIKMCIRMYNFMILFFIISLLTVVSIHILLCLFSSKSTLRLDPSNPPISVDNC